MYFPIATTFGPSGSRVPTTKPSGSMRRRRASRSCPAIVSKDSDFHQLSFVRGHPPRVVLIRRGNCSTDEIESLLRQYAEDLRAFGRDPDASFLAVS